MSDGPLAPDNPYRNVVSSIAEALQARDSDGLFRRLKHYRELLDAVELLLSPPNARLPLRLRGGAHSKHYMIELLPYVERLLASLPRGERLRVLDVGPGVGHGSQLLASLYRFPELGYRLDVTAIDIVPTYHYYAVAACRDVRHIVTDLNHLEETFHIVLASHVLEHVVAPVDFCELLQSKATMAVFVTAPYAEPADQLATGHLHSLDAAFLESIDAEERRIYESPAWGAMKDPPYKAFSARLPGRATDIVPPTRGGAASTQAAVPVPTRLVDALTDRPWAVGSQRDADERPVSDPADAPERVVRSGAVAGRDRGPASRRLLSVARRGLEAASARLTPQRGQALMDLATSAKVLLLGSGVPVSQRSGADSECH